MEKVSDYFGCMVFDDCVMRSMLSEEVYHSMKKTIAQGAKLDIGVANAVALSTANHCSSPTTGTAGTGSTATLGSFPCLN